jgi:hypothetical protein
MAEVRFLGCDNDVFCGNVQARAEEFEQASGQKLTVRLLDNDFYYAIPVNWESCNPGGATPSYLTSAVTPKTPVI